MRRIPKLDTFAIFPPLVFNNFHSTRASSCYALSLLKSRAGPVQKVGIHPTYHTCVQEVVASPLPTPLGVEQNFGLKKKYHFSSPLQCCAPSLAQSKWPSLEPHLYSET